MDPGQTGKALGVGMQNVGRTVVTGTHWFIIVVFAVGVVLRKAVARSTRFIVVIIEAIGTGMARIATRAAVSITVVTNLAPLLLVVRR